MSEHVEVETEIKAPPVKQKRKVKTKQARRKPAAEKAADVPIKGGEFAGVSATQCCSACTVEKCLISTVGVCKHPYKTGDAGCGPITIANREKVRKLIKHQMIDLRG